MASMEGEVREPKEITGFGLVMVGDDVGQLDMTDCDRCWLVSMTLRLSCLADGAGADGCDWRRMYSD
jgi:hypothetical protein